MIDEAVRTSGLFAGGHGADMFSSIQLVVVIEIASLEVQL